MHKTTTLKDFKVLVLKTFLPILVLSISFQVTFAQRLLNGSKGTIKPPAAAPRITKAMVKGDRSLLPGNMLLPGSQQVTGTPTDVPELNRRMAEKLSKNPLTNPTVRLNSPTTNSIIGDVCVFNGSLAAGDGTIANRIVRNGVPSSCAAPKACPGQNGTGPVYYDTYTMQNLTCATQCVSVTYENVGGDGDVFVVAYNGSFNNANVCTNYLADGGSSVPAGFPPITYTFSVPANATIVFVAGGVGNLTPMTAYRFTVTGLNCSVPPPCVPITAAVLSQTQYAGPPVNLLNEGFNTSVAFPGSALPAGWIPYLNSSPAGAITVWYSGNQTGVFPGQVGDYLAANYNHAGAALGTLSSWAVAPNFGLLKNGDKFSFYTRHDPGNARPDRLQVRMATTGANPAAPVGALGVGDYTTLLLDINPTYQTTGYPTVWQQYTITLSGLPVAGTAGRIAFRYFCENSGGVGVGINSDYIGIDEVVYTTFPVITPTTCPGSTANLKVDITGGVPGDTYRITYNANPPGGPAGNTTVTGYSSGDNIPVTPAVTTTYSLVSVISESNPCCISSANSGTPTVTVTPGTIQALQITAAPAPPLCAGDPTLLTVGGQPGSAAFTSAGGLTIPSSGTATPYPLPLNVAGLPAGATVASVRLNGFSHTWAGDVDIAVTGPTFVGGGAVQAAMLLSDLGNDALVNAVGVNLTFSDAAAGFVPTTSPMVSGTYKPTNNGAINDIMPAPGPNLNVANPVLTALNTATMNGTWNLWANDQVGGDAGSINSYTINFTWPAGPVVGYTYLWSPAAGLSSTTGNPVAASPPVTRQYSVLGTAPGGCQTSASILITVNQLPAITSNPTSVVACAGTTVTFTSTGSGAGIAYQWQLSTTGAGGPWVPVVNNATYSGANTSTLTITGVTAAMNGYRYRLSLSGTCPPAANSTSALLTVNPLPTVTIAQVSPVCGGTAGVSGTALTASGANSYVWTPNGLGNGLFNEATATTVYTGTNAATVYAAPIANTIYTVTGTNTGTGCFNTATVNVVYQPAPPFVLPNPVTMCAGDPAVLLTIQGVSPITQTFSSGAINVHIPDGPFPGPYAASVSSIPVTLPPGAIITGVQVHMNITHAYVGDVVAVLNVPGGKNLNLDALLGATNNAGANFTDTKINSTSATALSTGVAPFPGPFKPDAVGATFLFFGFNLPGGPIGYTPNVTSFSQLTTPTPANGNWTLALYDAGAPDEGDLKSWSVDITYTVGPPPPTNGVWSPATGLYTDANATNAYVAGTQTNQVYARPAVSTTYSVVVTSTGFDAFPVFTQAAPITIPSSGNGSPYPSNLVVSGIPTTGASVDQVVLTGFSHTWESDVAVALQSPTGTNTVIMASVGGANIVTNVNYTFRDGAPAMTGGANPSGTYSPTNLAGSHNFPAPGPGPLTTAGPLTTFTGNMNGTWKLFVIDEVGGDQGSIASWSIRFKHPTVGCQSNPRLVPVTVNTPTTVSVQPSNSTVCTDKVATFSVTVAASSTGPFTYRWQVSTDNGNNYTDINNGGVYSGATTATLTITQPPVSMSGYMYRCRIQGALPCPAIFSFQRVLTVNPLPTIVIGTPPGTPPYVTSLFPGLRKTITSTVSPFAAAANGYTWLRDGVAVPNENTGTLVVDIDRLGTYQLRVTDVNGCTNLSNTYLVKDSVSGKCFVYPNPNDGKFEVRYYSAANVNALPRSVTVYDAKGDRVFTKFFTIGRPYDKMQVDIRNSGKGLYWVEVGDMNGNRLSMCRVVIQ